MAKPDGGPAAKFSCSRTFPKAQISCLDETVLTRRSAQDSWDEGFLRELVGRLKRKGKDAAPWRDNEERCRRYHEHDRWAPLCEGVQVLKEE